MFHRYTLIRATFIGLLTLGLALLALWGAGNFPPVALANSGGGVTYRTLTKCTPTGGAILNSPTGTTFVNNTVVTLTADPNPGYDFSAWTGSITGSTNPVNITMNANKSVCATFVVDNTAPVITRTGDATVYVECGSTYTDAGATATDNRDGNITARIVVGGDTVDVDNPATYTITYNVQDDAENAATQVTRTVVVRDTVIPVTTVLGDDPVATPLGGTYIDAGATALDGCEGDLTEEIVVGGDTVNSNTLGEYVITYDVEDTAGNDAVQATRTVNVEDMTPPVITLLGANPQFVAFESTYSDPGATASDNADGNLTSSIVVSGDTVDTSISGNYTRNYNVSDAAGNEAETVSRVVTVLGPPQTLTVEGPVHGDILLTPPDPAHVVESGTGNYSDDYDFGTVVFLQVVPDAGYVFWEWGGDLFGASPEVLLADEFDDQSLDPAWTVTTGTWSEAGDEHLSVAAEASVTPQLTRSQSLADMNLQLDYRRVSGTAPFDILLRWQDANNHLFLSIDASQILLKEKASGSTSTLASATGAASGAGEWYHLEIESNGAEIRVWRKPLEGPETLLLSATAATLETNLFGFLTGADTAYDVDKLLLRDLKSRASVTMDAPHTVSAVFLPVDSVPPALNLLGEVAIALDCGEIFTDPGATAFDERHGILTQNIVVGGDAVVLETPGTYTITYDVMDRDGNAAVQVTRDVVVGDTTPPVITLLGDNPLYLARNGAYTDPGATAADNCDTALPAVTVDSTEIDSAAFGSYIVTYNVADAESNVATQVTRTVIVAPTLTLAKTNAGNTTPALGTHFYPLNAVVSLSATPGANFSHWEGDDINLATDNPIDITMSAAKSVTAVFHAGIYFPDANLEQAVRDAIGKPTATILPSDLEGLTALDAGDYAITDISGIQQIAALTSLVLSGNSISDLGPLAFLTGLSHLELSNVNPASLAPLGALTALTYLDLSSDELVDVSALEGLDALAELNLSDNAISDLQGLIDARILEGGTLDLTDNPLGALAYHVQIDVLRGHLANVAYNDVLGHETDGLRTLVVGVKQGLGTIAVNTVPTGGVEAHTLTNYENETYDLWLAEYPVDTGTFDAPTNPVSITAVPADGDGHLDYWMGSYFAYGPRDAAALSVILFDDTKLNAVIEGRPGMGTLDLVADFEDFVAEVLPAQDWATLDENGISYDSELNPVFTGNGMPDVAELGLLNAVLGRPELDLSSDGGVVSSFVWQGWEQNLAAAQAQLAPAIAGLSGKPYISRVVAAYMTLGDEASVAWINATMDAYAGQDVLDYDAYQRRYQRYFPAGRDADNDGATNLEEWEGLARTEVLLDDIAAFVAAALEPESLPQPPAKSAGANKQASTGCAMTDCLETVGIKVADPNTPLVYGGTTGNTVRATRGDTGQALPIGAWVSVPVGTEIRVVAQPNYAGKFRFMGWSSPRTLIDGSRELSEQFFVAPLDKKGDQFLVSAIFQRNRVTVPEDGGQWAYSVSGAVYGYHGAIYGGRWDDEEPYENYFVSPFGSALLSATYTPGNLPERWQLDGGFNSLSPNGSLFNPVAVRELGLGKGLTMTGAEDVKFVGLNASQGGTMVGGINGAMYGCVLFNVADGKDSVVRVDAIAKPGYKVNRIDIQGPSPFSVPANPINGTWALLVAGRETSARAVCSERIEYELTLAAGGDDPSCSGHVIAEPALKYYVPGMEVLVKAVAAGGCCYEFDHWQAGQDVFTKTGQPVNGMTAPSLNIAMAKDTTLTAVFKDLKKQTQTTGMNIHYVMPLSWVYAGAGYFGDIFHQELTVEAPSGWNWEGVVVQERLCYLSDDFGLTAGEKERLQHSSVGRFQVVQGNAQFPRRDAEPDDPIEKNGLWLAGETNLHGDKHALGVGGGSPPAYPTILNHFLSGPGTTGSVHYKQLYYIADPGSNTMSFGKKYIAEVMIEAKFEVIPIGHPVYIRTTNSLPFHQLIDKGGAHNSAAWGGVPNWFDQDYWDGWSNNYLGYGLDAYTDNEYCDGGCYPILFSPFAPAVVPD